MLDIADGAVARLVGATSPFGVQLDSLADLVSFGLAPAVLVHTWALPENPVVAWLSAFFWLACAAFRLARFNVTVDPLADKKYFVGLPSPGATLVVIATILALRTPEHGPGMLVPVGGQRRPGAADGDHACASAPSAGCSRPGPARRAPRPPCSALALVVGLVLDAGDDRARGRVRLPAHRAPRRAHRAAARAGLRPAGGGASAAPDAVGVPADHRRRGLSGGMACAEPSAVLIGHGQALDDSRGDTGRAWDPGDLTGLEVSAVALNRTVDALTADDLAAPSLLPGLDAAPTWWPTWR